MAVSSRAAQHAAGREGRWLARVGGRSGVRGTTRMGPPIGGLSRRLPGGAGSAGRVHRGGPGMIADKVGFPPTGSGHAPEREG